MIEICTCGHAKEHHHKNHESSHKDCVYVTSENGKTYYCECTEFVSAAEQPEPAVEPETYYLDAEEVALIGYYRANGTIAGYEDSEESEEEPGLFCANCGMDVKRGEDAGQYHFDCDCFNKIYYGYNLPFLTTDPLEHIKRKQLKES